MFHRCFGVGLLLSVLFGSAFAQHDALTQTSASGAKPSKGDLHAAELMKRFPAPGQIIDVGGRRLHLLCKGDPKRPSVVIEGGAFASTYSYFKAQDEMAKVAHVCVYDRAGLGWSDQAPLPRSLEDRIDDLHRLLNSGPVRPPLILAGHSMGGMLVRMYAKKYPSDVAALILIEASNERANVSEEARMQVTRTAAQVGMALPVLAAGGEIPQVRIPNGPAEQEIVQRESVFRAGQDDLRAMSGIEAELRKFGDLGTLGRKPLVVITRGRRDPGMSESMERAWGESHRWLSTLSSQSIFIVAENSGHMVNFDRPDVMRDATEQVMALLDD